MSSDVGIKIKDNESVFGAMKYEVFCVVLGIGSHPAEHTALSFGINT